MTYLQSEYEFDKKGNIKEENYYLSCGFLLEKSVYKYDNKGNNIKEVVFLEGGEDKLSYKIKYREFDKQGNWLRSVRIGKDLRMDGREMEYYLIEREIEYY